MTTFDLQNTVGQPVDLAAFADLCWWEGEGAALEAYLCNQDGRGMLCPHYDVQSGEWHLGLQWETPRDVQQVVVRFADAAQIPASALFSTLGRTAGRCIEGILVARNIEGWVTELVANIKGGDQRTWTRCDIPNSAEGRGLTAVPRGDLGHWVRIENKKIANYQAVVPSTWNASPRDDKGQRGPYEEALIGTTMANIDQPLEIIRTIHSFDPCLACAIHIIDPRTNEIKRFKIQ